MKTKLFLIPPLCVALLGALVITRAHEETFIGDALASTGFVQLHGGGMGESAEMVVTAYSEIDSCHYPNCEMANGERAYVGAAACPRRMKMGTTLFLEGFGYVVCTDRYSTSLSERIDIFMGYGEESHRKALEWGVKKLIAHY